MKVRGLLLVRGAKTPCSDRTENLHLEEAVELKKETGVLIVMADCKDPSLEGEFVKWYDQVHIPEVIQTGCYYAATRYENIRPKPGEARHVVVYQTDWDDPIAAFKELGRHTGKMRRFEAMETRFVAPLVQRG